MRLIDGFTFLPLVGNCQISINLIQVDGFPKSLKLACRKSTLLFLFFSFPPFGKPHCMTHCTIVFKNAKLMLAQHERE